MLVYVKTFLYLCNIERTKNTNEMETRKNTTAAHQGNQYGAEIWRTNGSVEYRRMEATTAMRALGDAWLLRFKCDEQDIERVIVWSINSRGAKVSYLHEY